MKTGQQIVDYINKAIEFAIERPEFCAFDGVDMEAVLVALNDVRNYAIADGEGERSRYRDFLKEKGFRSERFMTDRRPESRYLTKELLHELRDVADFWREYLQWRDGTK